MIVSKQEQKYYSELHAALRGYDTKLWAIPSVFVGVVGFVFNALKLNYLYTFSNTLVLCIGILLSLIFILQFYKAHFYHISIQKKINEYDNKFKDADISGVTRIPTESMTKCEINKRIEELKKQDPFFHLTKLQEIIIAERVTSWVKTIMCLLFLIQALLLFIILGKFVLGF